VSQHEVWTIGHGATTFDDFERRIGEYGIATVVDVRSQPFSRHAPDFTRSTLEDRCADAGLRYRWMGRGLGGRPDDPALRTVEGDLDLAAVRSSPAFAGAIQELCAVASASATVVLCAETDPVDCHRSTLVAPALEAAGFTVIDILGDGTSRQHQPQLPL
jgi:uncharacterized protein (DUF488 family)